MLNKRRFLGGAIGGLVFALLLVSATAHTPVTRAADNQLTPAAGDTFSGNDPARPMTDITVRTVNISNEPPGYLIDHLYATLGDVGFFVALGYLKDHSNGIISEEFYHAVETAPGSEVVYLTLLRNYRRPFTDSVEIGENGTIHVRALRGNATYPGFATVLSTNGQFNLTYALDPAYYIHTGTDSFAGLKYHYKCFAIAWKQGQALYLPLIIR